LFAWQSPSSFQFTFAGGTCQRAVNVSGMVLPQVLTHFELFCMFEFRFNSNKRFFHANGGLNVSLNTKNGCKTTFGCVSRLLIIATIQTKWHSAAFDV